MELLVLRKYEIILAVKQKDRCFEPALSPLFRCVLESSVLPVYFLYIRMRAEFKL